MKLFITAGGTFQPPVTRRRGCGRRHRGSAAVCDVMQVTFVQWGGGAVGGSGWVGLGAS